MDKKSLINGDIGCKHMNIHYIEDEGYIIIGSLWSPELAEDMMNIWGVDVQEFITKASDAKMQSLICEEVPGVYHLTIKVSYTDSIDVSFTTSCTEVY
jgi:hypothetical protein